MTGLLRKDFLLLAKALRAFALFALVFAVLSFSQSNGEDMGAAVGSYFFIMIVSALSTGKFVLATNRGTR